MITPHIKFIILITLMLNLALNRDTIVANDVNQIRDAKHTPIMK